MVSHKKRTKKKRKRQTSFMNLNDERVRKISGILIILMSLYLSIAFVSYLVTWKEDQDQVLNFSFNILFNGNVKVSNWLGRLGALVSNAFFYWGFGISSMIFVVVLFKLGITVLFKKSYAKFIHFFIYSLYVISFLSITLEYIFSDSAFSWGGAFGEATNVWLTNFIGSIGLLLLLIFTILAFFIWLINPKLETIQLSTGNFDIKFPTVLFKNRFQSLRRHTVHPKSDSQGFDVVTDGQREKDSSIQNNDSEEELPPSIDFNIDTKPQKTVKKPVDTELEIEIPDNQEDEVEKVKVEAKTNEYKVIPKDDIDTIKVITENEEEIFLEPYDPKKELSHYEYPTLDLLKDYSSKNITIDREELEANKDQIINTLRNYKIEIVKIRATIGPTVTLYEIIPAPGIKISKIKSLENDIALSLSALGIRIIAPIPGKGTIGIEVPNQHKQTVGLKDILKSKKFQETTMELPVALGKTISNEVFFADLAKMPHLLVAGATGQGKSVGINAIIVSLLYKKHPSEVKFVLIDPKKVELFPYNGMDKHFLAFLPDEDEAIVTDTDKVVYTLNSLIIEMEDRYNLLKSAKSRNIKEYNLKFRERKLNPKKGHRFLPYLVLVVDEFADLIMTAGKEVELPIARLAQLSRAVGIHLILATQRPSVNIITGVIKANFPARIAFKVTSKVDSRTILDTMGADQLVGRGDMLLSLGGASILRLQGAFIDTDEIENVVEHIENQQGYSTPFYLPEYKTEEDEPGKTSLSYSDLDDLFLDAAKLVVADQYGSTSLLQRKMQIGYNRAGRIMDQMETVGIVGPANGSKPREVLVYSENELIEIINRLKNK